MDLTIKKLASKLAKAAAGFALPAAAVVDAAAVGAAAPASADPSALTTTSHQSFYDLTQAAFVDAVDLWPDGEGRLASTMSQGGA